MVPIRKINQPTIVQPSNRWQGWSLGFLLFPIVVVIIAWYAYEYGRTGVLFNSMMADSTVSQLEQQAAAFQWQIKNLELERTKLREEVVVLTRANQIDREAARAVSEQVRLAQDKQLKMEEELVFLHGIISNKIDKKRLRVRDFTLQPSEGASIFKYAFTVSRVFNSKRGVKGELFITVTGQQKGQKTSLKLAALTKEKSKSLKVNFKHFQKFEGLLRLPEGFVASSMIIEIKPSKKKLPRLKETFKWSMGE